MERADGPGRAGLPPLGVPGEGAHAHVMVQQIDPGSIVVAVDGSVHAERAVRWASAHARLERCPLVAVAVSDEGQALTERAVGLAREVHPTLEVRAVTKHGDPRSVLLDLSSSARLLVLGSRGRGMLRSILLGSVSSAVSAHAACPVVVCRPLDEGQRSHGVVVGADGTAESLPVIEFAYRYASLHELPLTVLHCFWDVVVAVANYRAERGEQVDAPELEDLRALLAESVSGLGEQYPDVSVRMELEHGLVDEALGRRDRAWDLVVVGRHPMTTRDRVLNGSIATAVVERSRSPVAVVPEGARST